MAASNAISLYDPQGVQLSGATAGGLPLYPYGLGMHGLTALTTPKYLIGSATPGKTQPRSQADDLTTIARLHVDLKSNSSLKNLKDPGLEEAAKLLTSNGYVDFFLTQVNENYSEKLQIVKTMSDAYVPYFSGQEPPMLSVSGILMNSREDQWRIALTRLYKEVLRGTMLARRQVAAHLRYDGQIVSGFLINFGTSLQSNYQTKADFSMTFLVRQVTYLPSVKISPTRVPHAGFFTDEEGNALKEIPTSRSIRSNTVVTAVKTPERAPKAGAPTAVAAGTPVDPRILDDAIEAGNTLIKEAALESSADYPTIFPATSTAQ